MGWARACLGVSGSVAAVKAPAISSDLAARGVDVDVVVSPSAHRLMLASYKGAVPWQQLAAMCDHMSAKPQGEQRRAAGEGCAPVTSLAPACSTDDDRGVGRGVVRVFRDEDEWSCFHQVGEDEVLHVEIAKRCDLLLIAPLCANTLAAVALGTCGSLLTSVVRAWYYNLDSSFAAPLAQRFGVHTVERPVAVAPAMNTVMWHQTVTADHLQTLKVTRARHPHPSPHANCCADRRSLFQSTT